MQSSRLDLPLDCMSLALGLRRHLKGQAHGPGPRSQKYVINSQACLNNYVCSISDKKAISDGLRGHSSNKFFFLVICPYGGIVNAGDCLKNPSENSWLVGVNLLEMYPV